MYRTAQVTHGLATHQQVKQEVLTCSFTLKLHRNISITKYKLRLSPLKFYTCEIFKDFITAGSPISLNPSRPNISMHILHTGRRICLTIKGFLSCWSFLLLSWLICVICYMCYMLYVLYVWFQWFSVIPSGQRVNCPQLFDGVFNPIPQVQDLFTSCFSERFSFVGSRILERVFTELMSKGLEHAERVLLAGSRYSGLSAIFSLT